MLVVFVFSADDKIDIIMSVNIGNDDYVVKPFDIHVFTSKVQAMLRRAYGFGGTSDIVEHKGVLFNVSNLTVTAYGETTKLQKNEGQILQTLFENKGKNILCNENTT